MAAWMTAPASTVHLAPLSTPTFSSIEAETFGVLAGVAVVHAYAELIVAGSRRREGASPTDRVVIPLEACDGNDLVPVEINVAVGALESWLTAQIFGVEIFAGEAVAVAAVLVQRRS